MTFVTVSNGKNKDYKVNDDIYTPEPIAQLLISKITPHILPCETLYDPFRGNGAFYNNFPKPNVKEWSEIKDGKDFFDREDYYKVGWIISNPPYSKFDQVMKHSYEIAENICYLVPLSKIVASMKRVREIKKYGGIVKMWILPASKCGFPFGFPACFVWIKKYYSGSIDVEILDV